MEVKIKKEVITLMIQHAKALKPIECCGYLAGKDGEITTIYTMTNVDNRSDHFTFDPKEQFQVVKEVRKEGKELMSVYHSHPETPARLSSEDIKLLNDPNMIYIIVSLMTKDAEVKAYKINKPTDESVEIESVTIIEI
jgi:proteasome lid subunit RPN8/RPN11